MAGNLVGSEERSMFQPVLDALRTSYHKMGYRISETIPVVALREDTLSILRVICNLSLRPRLFQRSEVPSTVPVYVFVRIQFTTKGLSLSHQGAIGEAVKDPILVS
jgi:hypothetical protein